MSSSEVQCALRGARKALATLLDSDQGEADREAVRSLLATAVKLYAAAWNESPEDVRLGHEDEITATDAVLVSRTLLDAADVEPFELSLWGRAGVV